MPPKKNVKKNVKEVPAQKEKSKKPQISHEKEIKKNLEAYPAVIPTEKLEDRNKLETELQKANRRYLQIKRKLESLKTQESEIQQIEKEFEKIGTKPVRSEIEILFEKKRPTLIPMVTLGQTTPFEGTYTEDVEEWIEHFEWNCRVNGWDDHIKCVQLSDQLKGAARSWYNAQAMEHKVNYSIIKKKMLLAFKGLESPIQFLSEMQRCKQTEEETVDQILEFLNFLAFF